MARMIKYGFLLAFVGLMLWGFWSLLHPGRGVESNKGLESPGQNDGVFRVVLDPGHGGSDPGAKTGETMEKDINLTVALLVRDYLEQQDGVEVLMTRDEDVFLSLSDRVEFANQKKADLFVSIHSNSLDDSSYQGLMTFWTEKSKDAAQSNQDSAINKKSKDAAQNIQDATITEAGAVNRGVRTAEYVVIRDTNMPAALIEIGFITCPKELVRLLDPEYQSLLGQGIAKGILACRET